MFRLVKNEYIKLLRKGGFIALSLIFLAATILLPVLGFLLDKNEKAINDKLNGFVNSTLIESEKQSGNMEYVKMLELFQDEKISIYDLNDWRAFAGQVAYSSTRKVVIPDGFDPKAYDNSNYDYDEETDDEDTDNLPDFYSRFDVASLYNVTESKDLCKEITQEIKDNDLNAFKKTFNEKIYPAYTKLKETYGTIILNGETNDYYGQYKLAFDILEKYDIELDADDWTYDVALDYGLNQNEYNILKESYLNNSSLSDGEIEDVLEEDANRNDAILIDDYRLKEGISEAINENSMGGYTSESKFFSAFLEYKMLVTLAGLILFMVGIGIISKEYNQGTIKFLLVNPVKRSSIFWSKVITLISMLVIATLWLVVSQLIFNTIFFGAYPKGIANIYLKNGHLVHESGVLLITKNYLNAFLGALMLCLAAIFLSALIRNGAFAAGITLFTYLGGSIIGGLLAAKGFYVFQFALFQNVDLLAISKGKTSYRMQSLTFSSIVLIVHAIIFLWAARDSFVKKDI